MKMPSSMSILAGVALAAVPVGAMAQWDPGSEIVGQTVQVTTNGVSNTVRLGPGGQAEITTPGGNVIPASWTAANGQLCLNTGVAQECWAYTSAFQAGQPVTLSSTCGSSTWVANAINQPLPPPPAVQGERG